MRKALDGTIEKDAFSKEAQEKLYPLVKSSASALNFGKILRFELLKRDSKGNLSHYNYRVTFENSKNTIYFVLNQENKIAGINIR